MAEVLLMAVRFRLQELLDTHQPKRMTQTALADKSGVSLVTINAMANNRTKRVDLETIDAISSALGVEPGALFERASVPKRKKSA